MKKQLVLLPALLLCALCAAQANPLKKLRVLKQSLSGAKPPRVSIPSIRPAGGLRGLPQSSVTGQKLLRLNPEWKTPFLAKFTPQELQTIEKAFLRADNALFVQTGESVTAVSGEWDYAARFEWELDHLLQVRGQSFTLSQRKQLFGGTGVKGTTLADYFKLLSLETWLLTHGGEYPRRQFSVDGRLLPVEELSPDQLAERQLANNVKWTITHPKNPESPVFRQLAVRYERGSRKKTPADWLEELQIWLAMHGGEYPRSTFSVNGKRVSASEYTPEQKAEAALANGVTNAISSAKDLSDPVIARLVSLKEAGRRNNTPQEALAELKAWMSEHGGVLPRSSFVKDGRFVPVLELTPEEQLEKRLGSRIRAMAQNNADSANPAILEIREILKNGAQRKTPAEWTAELEMWLASHDGQLPRRTPFKGEEVTPELAAENALARGVYNTLSRAKISPSPEADALRRVWERGNARVQRRTPEEWLETFSAYLETYRHYPPKGTPEYAGIYNLLYRSPKTPDGKYEDPVVQQLYEFDRLARAAGRGEIDWKDVTLKEDSPLLPFWRKASPRQRAALSTTAREMERLRNGFSDWVTSAVENKWVVWDGVTDNVFANLGRGLETWGDSRADEADDILVWLNETSWGKDESLDLFTRVCYKGSNPHSPKLRDFYELQEFNGFPAGKERPSVPGVSFDIKSFSDGETRLKSMRLGKDVRPEDIRRALEEVLPQGADFTFRMGPHELGVDGSSRRTTNNFYAGQLHIHAEAQVPGEPVILSYTLEIDARALARGKDEYALKRLYMRLFKSYLSQGAWRFLSR